MAIIVILCYSYDGVRLFLWSWVTSGPFVRPPNEIWVNMEQWWDDTDRKKPKDVETNLPQCHSVHHMFHMDWPGRWSSLRGLKPTTNRLS
jgi:hypothetical protein